MGEFGSKFRKAREKKNLSLDDVSHVTKIGSRMLQAIEEERFDRLPGGIFNKGFIRAYAKQLELNDEDAINDYLACLRKAQIDAQEVVKPDRPGQPRAAAPEKPGLLKQSKSNSSKSASHNSAAKSPTPAQVEELPELQLPRAGDIRPRRKDFGSSDRVIPWRMLAMAVLVIALGVVLWTRRSHRVKTAAASSSPANTLQIAPPLASAPASNPPSASVSTSNRPPAAHLSNSNQPLLRSASASATHSPALAPAAAANNGVAVPTSPSNPAPPEKSTAPLTLVIRATETSWISVLADGQPVSHETLIAPARTTVRATREIIVKVGNAAGVAFLWNGQEIPPDGAESEVKTFVFNSNGMRAASATPPPAQ